MKKLDPVVVKGFLAEERLIRLARALKGELPICRVRRTGTQLDVCGVDVLILLSLWGKILKVPVQVKSSTSGVAKYHKKHSDCIEAGVVIIVVATNRSDESIQRELASKLERIIASGKNFDLFLSKISPSRENSVWGSRSWKRKKRIVLEQIQTKEDFQAFSKVSSVS